VAANSSNKASGEFLREIRKFEARLNDFLKEEEALTGNLKKFIEKLRDACDKIERLKNKPEELEALRLEIAQALNDVLKSEGEAQHERSHLLESYGALILALEKELQRTCAQG
jgi:chromosome segregation ATPase